MRLCYIDESGTPQIPGNTSHYILAGLSIPINKWKKYDNQIEKIKSKGSFRVVKLIRFTEQKTSVTMET